MSEPSSDVGNATNGPIIVPSTEIIVPEKQLWVPDRPGNSLTGSWTQGINTIRPAKDVFTEFAKIEGELNDEEARATLAEFLYHNPRFLMEWIGGIQMFPIQELILKGWAANEYNLGVWGRGFGKTLAYHNESQLLEQTRGLIALPDLLPNVDFTKEGWVDINPLMLWNGEGWRRTDKIYVQPQKNCLRVKTEAGFELEGSTNHLIKVWNPETLTADWKKYDQIQKGDYVCISRDVSNWGDRNSQADLDEGYLVGLLLGDGSYARDRYQCTLTSMDEEILQFVEKRYPCTDRRQQEGNRAFALPIRNEFRRALFEKWGVKHCLSYDKVIPPQILKQKDVTRECLRGLFDTDGWITTESGTVGITLTSKQAILQIQLLLLSFGIISRRKERTTESDFGKAWALYINGREMEIFAAEIGFGISRKQDVLKAHLDRKRNTNIDIVPGAKEYCQAKIKSKFRLSKQWSKEWRDKIRRKENQRHLSYATLGRYVDFFERAGIPEDVLAPVKACLRDHLFFSPVTEIESRVHDCLDFNVPTGERYWTNGFISHNSFSVSLFSLYWAIFNPGVKIVIASFSFRQSRAILESCAKLINEEGAERLKGCFPIDLRTKTDEYVLNVPNGAVIKCLPLGDGKKIRGQRCDCLVLDEAAFLPESIIHEILRPFLASNSRIKEQREIDARESRLIAEGKMREEDRTVLEDRKKVIFLSSASWQFEHLFKRYKDWTDLISLDPRLETNHDKIEGFKKNNRGFFISRLSWEAAPKGLLNISEILQAKEELSEAMFNREYGAQFTADSDGYFRASKMEACTVPNGESPAMELVGEEGASYVLGVDQNASGSDSSDHFAMCLMKIVTRETDGRKLGMVVHQYAMAGCGLKDHALYLLYLLTRFNVVYIAVDASQGNELEFINVCNQNPLFESKGIKLQAIQGVDFNRTDFNELPKDIKRGYNKTAGQIVHRQRFSSEWQRPANEFLQAAFDHRNILFASKIAANEEAVGPAMAVDISILNAHEGLADMSIAEFIANQDYLQDLVKKECSMIQVKTSDLGTMSWGLPQNLKRTSGANRVRKDSYSALLIANWAVKMYTAAMDVQVQTGPQDFPYGWAA